MKQYSGRKLGTQYGRETLIIHDIGQTVSVDRTTAARAWCQSRGMAPAYTVTAAGETFTVWAGVIRCTIGGTMDAACAIPA